MSLAPLDNLMRIGQLKAEPAALIRVADEVAKRACALGAPPG